jgi:hypothetical protein
MSKEKTIKKLKSLVMVLSHRQVGHTTLMRVGIQNYDRPFGVIGHNKDLANSLLIGSRDKLGKSFTISNLENSINSIISEGLPIAIDHAALVNEILDAVTLLEDAPSEEEVRSLVAKAVLEVRENQKDVLSALMEMVEIYQDRTISTESLALDYVLCPWWKISKKWKIRKDLLKTITESNQSQRLYDIFKSLKFQSNK